MGMNDTPRDNLGVSGMMKRAVGSVPDVPGPVESVHDE